MHPSNEHAVSSINHVYVQTGKWLDALRSRSDKLEQMVSNPVFVGSPCAIANSPLCTRGVTHGMFRIQGRSIRSIYTFRREEEYPMRLSYGERRSPSRDFRRKKLPKGSADMSAAFEADLRRFSI